MSLTWYGHFWAVEHEIAQARKAGIQVFAASGNEDTDASNEYLSFNTGVNCIAGVDEYYNKMYWSNRGSLIVYQAPGHNITSLGVDSDFALWNASGTSAASPHAAGTAAIFMSWKGLINEDVTEPDYLWYNSKSGLVDGIPRGKCACQLPEMWLCL